MIAALSGRRAHLLPIVLLAIYTGMRRGRFLSCVGQTLILAERHFVDTETKSGKDRAVQMSGVARALLELRAEADSSGLVFLCVKTGDELRDIKHGFASACVDVKIEGLRFHDLPHTFGTGLADAYLDPFYDC